ncbi:antitoxin Xre-like helix-turn-helix domain-containing protein [Sphingomonas sp. ID0503]|uniref:antitoxin Xre-like helix-turn-helix domain-containing protein n=1 Tax=Sphingomonas sp. ID0503 TaxID=3399691 RepID=UPI003AFAE55D
MIDDANDLGGPALRTFFEIAERWSLTDEEQRQILGLSSSFALHRWRTKAQRKTPLSLPHDTLERIGHIIGIYRSVHTLLPLAPAADRWIRALNTAPLFGGRSALTRMLEGDICDLRAVRSYLDAALV